MLKTLLTIGALCASTVIAQAAPEPLTVDTINAARWSADNKGEARAAIFKAQVLLDRAGFSPGVIDAHDGENFRNALKSYQQQNGLQPTGKLDEPTWTRLAETSSAPAAVTYAISAKDVQGPFIERVPKDYEAMAELDRLAYHSPRERLSENFHMDEDLLALLNKGQDFTRPDVSIIVANVARDDSLSAARKNGNTGSRDATAGDATAGKRRAQTKGKGDIRVEVNKSGRFVRVLTKDGRQVAYYPASVGSDEKPAPSGVLEVRAIAENPTYRYNPDFKFKGQKATEPVEIAAGPNNPVGAVWIALSADTYGIHGTAHPEKVGKGESHGCVRLTNWDALALAKLVRKGVKVEFVE